MRLLSPFRFVLVGAVWCESFPVLLVKSQRASSTMASTAAATCQQGGQDSSESKPIYRAYPLSMLAELKEQHNNVKTIHIVRHAEGTHNVNQQYKDEVNLDARLTPKGVSQCEALAQKVQADADPASLFHVASTQLVVTSTMTRCIQTALHSFPHLADSKIPFVAHELIRETVNYACDRRRPLSETRKEFTNVDFESASSYNTEVDEIWQSYVDRIGLPAKWNDHRESAELHRVVERGRQFFTWLSGRNEMEVILCTHAAFLRCILSWGQEGGVEFIMEQVLDERGKDGNSKPADVPLFHYHGDAEFEQYVRRDFGNSEMRTFVVVFDQAA